MALPKIAPYDMPDPARLPAPRGPWRLAPARAALLVHDMQNYFLRIYDPGAAPLAPLVRHVALLVRAARQAGVPVFYTAQDGDQYRPDRGLQADLWGPGMTAAPEHRDIAAGLEPAAGDIVLTKHRYSAFHRSNLEHLLRARGRDQLVICGVYAHIGCLATATDAFMRDVEAFVVADAMADFSREQHEMTLAYIADCVGVPLATQTVADVFAGAAR
ncbi:isochorismatase family protein [Zavarzinia compransoris]|uniref:2,3-dihydro-2,3-dihydroxybenzoate synthetase n=1 Tax=Zavarzinia compransoris TaxID=1264899 RepID=A0A317DT14_9PROT|nr:isochorismatase family protein [Zavarzinia compransoris]PWR17827.1 2,3-dihydro-2,3-dihydroxybenzoate synthetase [Zavarzinia compransoris]TDP49360.1 bifunctional isochorismate lyase/aryl carrier protein [Zavarzinia compransoris]